MFTHGGQFIRYIIDISGYFGEWCNGSTTDSDSVCLGSNPSSPANPCGVAARPIQRTAQHDADSRRDGACGLNEHPQPLRRLVDESVGYGLALEGISAADVARSQAVT